MQEQRHTTAEPDTVRTHIYPDSSRNLFLLVRAERGAGTGVPDATYETLNVPNVAFGTLSES